MGMVVAKVKNLKSPQIVHLDCDPTNDDIAIGAGYTSVNKRAIEFTVPTNTFVSERKLVLNKNIKVKISCTGGGVIRIGLTTLDPYENDQNVLQGSVFEKEEGYGQEETSRTLYKTDFNFCYGPPGIEIEYEYDRKGNDVWLYVIYVYGVPEVKAELVENDEVGGEEILLCAIAREQLNKDNISANTAACRIREPIVEGDVYHCRWNMKLENDKISGTSPTHGYMCLRLIAVKQRTGEVEDDIIWERKSAVQEYPFSSVIAFRLSIQKKVISHNLFVNSVGNIAKDYFIDGVEPKCLYVEIEFSSGEIEVGHELGRTVLITNYKCDDEEASTSDILMEISAKIRFKPRRIQFGDSPISLVLEFNERLTDTDVEHIGTNLRCPVKPLRETDTVQVLLNETNELDEDNIKLLYRRTFF